jgi:hypothetical protein
MDRFDQPLSQESRNKPSVDELDAYKQQCDLELEEKELAALKIRPPVGD